MNPAVVKKGVEEYLRSVDGERVVDEMLEQPFVDTAKGLVGSVFEAGVKFAMQRMRAGARRMGEAKLDKYFNEGDDA